MKKFVLTALMLGVSGSAALAADIAPAAYDWTGLYIGLNGGYAFHGTDRVGVPPDSHVGDLNINGGYGGAQIGYNKQIDNIVLGLEGDIQGGSISDKFSNATTGYFAKDNLNWFGTFRGRAGFAADRVLFYGTGGVAFGGGDYKIGSAAGSFSKNYSGVGWVAGAGVEYAVTDSLSIKAEYLYTNFGRFGVGAGALKTQATPDFHTVRIGVNFRF